jgi:hypothetical protein
MQQSPTVNSFLASRDAATQREYRPSNSSMPPSLVWLVRLQAWQQTTAGPLLWVGSTLRQLGTAAGGQPACMLTTE